MRLLPIAVLLPIIVNSSDLKSCKACHPIIYSEFEQSMHKKSTIKDDKIHQAVWNKHPLKAKGEYKCAKCHTPQEKIEDNNQGVTCLSCHTIKSIEEHKKANKNIYETKDRVLYSAQKGMEDKIVEYKKESSWFGLSTKVTGSPYHDVDYRNEIFYNGKVCIGCHSHKENSLGFTICKTDEKGAKDKEQNCITCHMPQVKGSATNIRVSQTHAFHGFAGAINSSNLLKEYIDMSYEISNSNFYIDIENRAPHNLLLHPLRVVELRVKLTRDGNSSELQRFKFKRTVGNEGKPSAPWLATEVVENSMIKAHEKRRVKFDKKLKSGDEVEATLGYYIVDPKTVDSLGLDKDKFSKFKPIKNLYFKVKE